jgi:predicted nucleic acid-binding Zn ribbon protein
MYVSEQTRNVSQSDIENTSINLSSSEFEPSEKEQHETKNKVLLYILIVAVIVILILTLLRKYGKKNTIEKHHNSSEVQILHCNEGNHDRFHERKKHH